MDMRAFFSVKNMSNNTHYKGGDMGRLETLKERQLKLKEDIASMLDSFLIGTVAKSPSMTGHNLTTKVAPVVLEMSKRYKMLWALIQALSKVNWELINLDNK
jgi:hypothetical protein